MAINIHRNEFKEYDVAQEVFEIGHDSKGFCFTVKRPNGSVVATLPNGLRTEERQLATLLANAPLMLDTLEMLVEDGRVHDIVRFQLAKIVKQVRGE